MRFKCRLLGRRKVSQSALAVNVNLKNNQRMGWGDFSDPFGEAVGKKTSALLRITQIFADLLRGTPPACKFGRRSHSTLVQEVPEAESSRTELVEGPPSRNREPGNADPCLGIGLLEGSCEKPFLACLHSQISLRS